MSNALSVLPAGRYVVAVSGGVDSMVLLHMLLKEPTLELIVAHLDHGIRNDSREDRELVWQFTMSHKLEFVSESANLGLKASEALARGVRYDFLRRVRKKYNAQAIITAHHQDDLLETAIINLVRGTGRRGLTALRSHDDLLRPLLNFSKAELVKYAVAHRVPWREDSTNSDTKYLRNLIRSRLGGQGDLTSRQQLLKIIARQKKLNEQIDQELHNRLEKFVKKTATECSLVRYTFIMAPADVAYEVLQCILKEKTGSTLEKQLTLRALLFIKTARPHKRLRLMNGWQFYARKNSIIVCPPLNMVS